MWEPFRLSIEEWAPARRIVYDKFHIILKESLEKLWDYRYEGAMLNYLQKWIDQLRWQRLPSF